MTTTTPPTTDTTPRAWIVCLSCYSSGRLVGELDPITAAAWGQCLTEVDEHLRPALCAWVESGDYVAEGTGDLPSISDFEERYQGAWDSFRDYAEQLADDIGLLDVVPEEIARYFDWRAWIRDLAFDYSTYDDPEGGVFVFRDL